MTDPSVPRYVLDAAEMSGGLLRRRYIDGGGSASDFETDFSAAIATALEVSQQGLVDEAS